MTYRVVYTKAGGIFPEAHDFAYRQAAEDWATLCRAGGWEAEVVPVEPSVADLAASQAAHGPTGERGAERRVEPILGDSE